MVWLRKLRDTICLYAGWAAVLGMPPWVTYLWTSTYGTQWEFGRFGMARSLVDETGTHYADGTPIIPAELSLIQSGQEEEFRLMMVCGLAGLFVVYVFTILRFVASRESLEVTHTEWLCGLSRQMPPGCGQLATPVIARQWQADE